MGLLAHYKFDGNTNDSGPFELDGVPSNITYGTGIEGQCAVFNGTNSIVTIANDPLLQITGDLTIAFFMKYDVTGERITLIDKAYGGEFTINLETGEHLRFYCGDSGSNASPYSSLNSANLIPSEWHHYAFVRVGGIFSIYIDSVVSFSARYDVTGSASTADVRIGKGYTAGYFKGSMEDLRFYSRALSARDVKLLASKVKTTKILQLLEDEKDLIAHYKCSDKQFSAHNFLGTGIGGKNAHEIDGWSTGATDTGKTSEFDTPIFEYITANTIYVFTDDECLDDDLTTFSEKNSVFSVYARRVEGSATGAMRIYDSVSGYTTSPMSLTTEFKRFTMTKVIGTSPTRMFVMIDDTGGGTIEFHSAQLERKDVPTNFVKHFQPGIARDFSEQKNHSILTRYESPEWTTEHPYAEGSYRFRKSVGSYMRLPVRVLDGVRDFTFVAWVKFNTFGALSSILSCANSINNNEVFFRADVNLHPSVMIKGDTITGTKTLTTGVWYHLAIACEGSSIKTYVNTELDINEIISSDILDIEAIVLGSDQDIVMGDFDPAQALDGWMTDIRIYRSSLSAEEITDLYNERNPIKMSIDKEENIFTSQHIRKELKYNNLVDTNEWTTRQYGSQGSWARNGSDAENTIRDWGDPWGRETKAWYCIPDAVSDGDGGYNKNITIDTSKAHRFSVFLYKYGSVDGSIYFGCMNNLYSTLDLAGAQKTNPYFWNGEPPALNTWYLLVGLLHENGYGTTDTGVSGVYDMFGNKLVAGTEFKATAHKLQRIRNYLFYSTDQVVRAVFLYPRVDVIDGTEPTIMEIVSGLSSYEQRSITEHGKYLPVYSNKLTPKISSDVIDLPEQLDNEWVDLDMLKYYSITKTVGLTAMSSVWDKGKIHSTGSDNGSIHYSFDILPSTSGNFKIVMTKVQDWPTDNNQSLYISDGSLNDAYRFRWGGSGYATTGVSKVVGGTIVDETNATGTIDSNIQYTIEGTWSPTKLTLKSNTVTIGTIDTTDKTPLSVGNLYFFNSQIEMYIESIEVYTENSKNFKINNDLMSSAGEVFSV